MSNSIESFALLMVIFQTKHFIADYPLQTAYMLGKFQAYPKYILPLAAHAGVHALFTGLIVLAYQQYDLVLKLVLLDFVTHFFIDRIKASPSLLGRYKPNEKQFWWALGLDQMAHHCVMILCAGLMMG